MASLLMTHPTRATEVALVPAPTLEGGAAQGHTPGHALVLQVPQGPDPGKGW